VRPEVNNGHFLLLSREIRCRRGRRRSQAPRPLASAWLKSTLWRLRGLVFNDLFQSGHHPGEAIKIDLVCGVGDFVIMRVTHQGGIRYHDAGHIDLPEAPVVRPAYPRNRGWKRAASGGEVDPFAEARYRLFKYIRRGAITNEGDEISCARIEGFEENRDLLAVRLVGEIAHGLEAVHHHDMFFFVENISGVHQRAHGGLLEIGWFFVGEKDKAKGAVGFDLGEMFGQRHVGHGAAAVVVRAHGAKHAVVMRPDNDDLIREGRAFFFCHEVIAVDVSYPVYLPVHGVSEALEITFDQVGRAVEVLWEEDVALSDRADDILHVTLQFFGEGGDFGCIHGWVSRKTPARHVGRATHEQAEATNYQRKQEQEAGEFERELIHHFKE